MAARRFLPRFLALGPGAHGWLVEAAAAVPSGSARRWTAALELAALVGVEPVDAPWGPRPRPAGSPAVTCSRSSSGATNGAPITALVVADKQHSVQPGTSA